MNRKTIVDALNTNVNLLFQKIELKEVHCIYEKYIEKMDFNSFVTKFQKLLNPDLQNYVQLKIYDLLIEHNILKIEMNGKILYI